MLTLVLRTYLAKKRLLLQLLPEAELTAFLSNRLDLGMALLGLESVHYLLAALTQRLWSFLTWSNQHLSNSVLHPQPRMSTL